jgi:hypothetical protein
VAPSKQQLQVQALAHEQLKGPFDDKPDCTARAACLPLLGSTSVTSGGPLPLSSLLSPSSRNNGKSNFHSMKARPVFTTGVAAERFNP